MVRGSSGGFTAAIDGGRFGRGAQPPSEGHRGVALTARAPDSKSGGWGFESLHPCHSQQNEEGREETSMGALTRIREFVQEVLAEFRKVTWPSRSELVNSTVVVIVVTVVLAFFLGGVDVVLARVVERILR